MNTKNNCKAKAKSTRATLEITGPDSHCTQCDTCGPVAMLLASREGYRLAVEAGIIDFDMPVRSFEAEVGSYEWAISERNEYWLRDITPPHSLQRIIDAHKKASA